MRELPLIFTAESVKALLAGKKTQTRRVVSRGTSLFDGSVWPKSVRLSAFTWAEAWVDKGPSPVGNPGPYLHVPWVHPPGGAWGPKGDRTVHRIYPRVRPGDRLWVKETFGACRHGKNHPACIDYRADGFEPDRRWTSPIFMPRGASRITLEVTGLRIERLQTITEDDARAEGVVNRSDLAFSETGTFDGVMYRGHRAAYAELWDKINGRSAPWESNPWVIVLEFKRQQQPGATK